MIEITANNTVGILGSPNFMDDPGMLDSKA